MIDLIRDILITGLLALCIRLIYTHILNIIKDLCKFLNLLDKTGSKLSITNIVMLIIVIKVALVPHPSMPDLGTLLLALLNYSHKRHIESQNKPSKSDE